MAEEASNDRFKTFNAVLIALVSLVAAVGGARAGLVSTEDNELTRTGLINKSRAAKFELSTRLTASNQLEAAREFVESRENARLLRLDAVSARQQGLETDAIGLESRATSAQDEADILANRSLYTVYLDKSGKYDTARLLDHTIQSPELREYRSLQPESYLERGDARGAIGIRTMWALAVMSLSLVFFGTAEMISHRARYGLVAAGLTVVGVSIWLMVKA